MGKGASARPASTHAHLLGVPSAPSVLSRFKVGVCLTLWLIFSVLSLFVAKHLLQAYHLNEAVFSMCQFFLSVLFGLLFTKVLRVHPLSHLSRKQLWAVVPLSITFLVKELLKYVALSRISINLVNTIRSLGPLFNVVLELVFLGHRPQRSVVWALCPIVVGVSLTSLDEIHVASASDNSLLVVLCGFFAAILSTAINNGQNIYSKILFGRDRIDPVSLQIYLSAISFALMSPLILARVFMQVWHNTAGRSQEQLQLLLLLSPTTTRSSSSSSPSAVIMGLLVFAGLVNFVASQLAFNSLRLVSPLSYSVANTLKRVAIAVLAMVYMHERVSAINAVGIAVSIGGIFVYERNSRSLREARQYRNSPAATSSRKPSASDVSARGGDGLHQHEVYVDVG